MASPAQKTEADLVADAARSALNGSDGDVQRATKAMEAKVRGNSTLFHRLMDPLVSNACYTAVTAECRRSRKKVWAPPPEKLKASKVAGAFRVVQLAAGSLLMFPLPGGRRLGEATRDEIAAAAAFYENQSADMAHKARWLRLVGQSIPSNKKVGDVLTDERLRELQEVAHGA